MQQQQRPQRKGEHQRAECHAGRPERRDCHGQQNGKNSLLVADDSPGQFVQRPECSDETELRQHVDAEHVTTGGAIGDVGKPERQRRSKVSSDLMFPAERQHGREISGRTLIEQQRQQ